MYGVSQRTRLIYHVAHGARSMRPFYVPLTRAVQISVECNQLHNDVETVALPGISLILYCLSCDHAAIWYA